MVSTWIEALVAAAEEELLRLGRDSEDCAYDLVFGLDH